MNRATTQVGSVELEGLGALLECRHENPFALLGPHIVEHQGVRSLRVRAYLPDMHAAWLCPDQVGESTPMRRVHPAGLFEAEHPRLVADPTAYKIRFESRGGAIRSMRDPYAFPAFLSEFDLYLFGEGKHWLCYEKLGAHLRTIGNTTGVNFAVWAPNASGVSVVGDFNGWDGRRHPMRKHIPSGVWELFIPEIQTGEKYKYRLQHDGIATDRSDPYGFAAELPPRTASIVSSLDQYAWNDQTWLEQRQATNALERPISIYEVHLGSWRRKNDAGKHDTDWLDYRELAKQLVAYCQELNYTHIELLPVSEHPFTGSWGYQTVGYFAATSRYGRPEDLMYFVDYCHQHGIGVILDWVPAHYPRDGHGLYRFDGTALYEHADPRQGEHPDWGTTIFNYGRSEVRNFLLSNALFWLDKYHIDGLRVDAVASMLYLDYSRKEGEWIPNRFGGRENLEAISLLKEFNEITHAKFPGILTIAEESTAWGGVSRPTASGGLGFSLKWNMGWMNDTLRFMAEDPIHRRYHHNELTFSMIYAFSENFCLPLSHDEVVHGKRAMLDQMPGDLWQKFANLRLLYSYMWMHPGKKLLFMGNELAQWNEWNHDGTLQWGLLEWETHRGIQRLVGDLNRFYREQPALFEIDFDSAGFEWIDCQSANESLLGFLRKAKDSSNQLLVYCNFTPVVRQHHRVGVPQSGWYQELFNSDSAHYGGSNVGNFPGVEAEPCDSHGRPWSISVTVPPLGVVVFRVPRANSASNGG